jgi:hypothetical protein
MAAVLYLIRLLVMWVFVDSMGSLMVSTDSEASTAENLLKT